MTYLIEQREDDRLAFNISDTAHTRDSANPNIKASWAGIIHGRNPRVAIREAYAQALEARFQRSALHSWLTESGIDYSTSTDECYDYGPLVLRFSDPGAAMLFKLAHYSGGK